MHGEIHDAEIFRKNGEMPLLTQSLLLTVAYPWGKEMHVYDSFS